MPHEITIDDDPDANTNNEYRLLFSGDGKPKNLTINGASASNPKYINHNVDGRWVVRDSVWGGRDAWSYSGQKVLMKFEDPGRISIKINDDDWKPATTFDATAQADFDDAGGGNGSPDPDEVLSSDAEYEDFFESPIPITEERRVSVEPGTYSPGAVQRTILHSKPRWSMQAIGNPDNPYAVDVSRANHNFTILCKDEHFWMEGMTWGRTQFSGCGDPYCRNMVFTDRRGKSLSGIGGKRACGRYIQCDLGHKDDPDEYAGYFYGGGEILVDWGNTIRAAGSAYFGTNNHVTINIRPNNEFASGEKEVIEDSGVYPNDLHDGLNTFIGPNQIV